MICCGCYPYIKFLLKLIILEENIFFKYNDVLILLQEVDTVYYLIVMKKGKDEFNFSNI